MKTIEKCIQLKIDQLIENASPKNDKKNNQSEEVNEVEFLISYNHCLDLFDFLQNYSKIQKNELIFQIAILYEILGYHQLSLDYINESLKIIPNVPTIILFKSCLYAAFNRLDESQKCLLKYKYLIGEDIYCNYIYNSIRIVYLYLLEYEENIILREIDLVENKYQKYYENNVILFYIKSKVLLKLSEKLKKIDKERSIIYEKDSINNRDKILNKQRINVEYLYKMDINNKNIMTILAIIFPNFKEYKPKALTNYNSNFHNGFGLFFTLIKICKIFKYRIEMIKSKKNTKNKIEKKSNTYLKRNSFNENSNFDKSFIYNDNQNNNINNHDMMKELPESIISLSKSLWLANYIPNLNHNETNKESKCKKIVICQNKSMKNNDINDRIKTNYYIYKGYYSNLNLKESILYNINYNKEYKEKILGKDSLLDEINKDFQSNRKINKSDEELMFDKKYSFLGDNEIKMLNNKIIENKKNEKRKKNNYNIKLIKSQTQNNNNINKTNKNKIIKLNIDISKNNIDDKNKRNSINKENKDKEKKIIKKADSNIKIFDYINNSNCVKNNSKISNSNKNYSPSNNNPVNNNEILFKKEIKNEEQKSLSKKVKINYLNNYPSRIKKENKKWNENIKLNQKKNIVKNTKNSNNVNNIDNNIIILGSNNMYLSRNNTKPNINETNNKEKELTIINELDKNQESNSDLNNKKNNKNEIKNIIETKFENYNKLNIYHLNNLNNINYGIQSSKERNIKFEKNGKMKDIRNYYFKKKENSQKTKKLKILETINKSEKIDKKIHRNLDKIIYDRSTENQNNRKKKILKNTPKYLQKTINEKNFTLGKRPYNAINLKEYVKKNKSNNNIKNNNYIKDILTNKKIHNKIEAYLEYNPRKENIKSEKKKKCQLSIQEKHNYFTINGDLLTKSKAYTPKYNKIHFLGSFTFDSKDQKKEYVVKKIGIQKKNINSQGYIIRLRKKLQNDKSKANSNESKSSFNKIVNNNLKIISTKYFNNIINSREFNKNSSNSSYKLGQKCMGAIIICN